MPQSRAGLPVHKHENEGRTTSLRQGMFLAKRVVPGRKHGRISMDDNYPRSAELTQLERQLADRQDTADLMSGLAAVTANAGAHRMTLTEALAEIASGQVTLRGLLAGIHRQYGRVGHV